MPRTKKAAAPREQRIRDVKRKQGVAHFNFVDGKLTLWDNPREDTLPVAYVVRDGHIAFQERLDD